MTEPTVAVGLMDKVETTEFALNGNYRVVDGSGADVRDVPFGRVLQARREGRHVVVMDPAGEWIARAPRLEFEAIGPKESTFVVHGMRIGVEFHWDQQQDLRFYGSLRLVAGAQERMAVINRVGLEQYLKSVICSEMSGSSPAALLEAHAVISRSWLMAQLASNEQQDEVSVPMIRERSGRIEIDRWYDRENHSAFDVCADDHCQRYQGIDRSISDAALRAVDSTSGVVLVQPSTTVDQGEICDARFSKCCGGVTEDFETAWHPSPGAKYPYLKAVIDTSSDRASSISLPLGNESNAIEFIHARPDVWCNIRSSQADLLDRVLPEIDQKTRDEFFRWRVTLEQEQLQGLIRKKTGFSLGHIRTIRALTRGGSGRIDGLLIEGSERHLRVGRELEIRRVLSSTHLLSSAFVVTEEYDSDDTNPARFVLHGAGWGHGVGLCQIGAAAMAAAGHSSAEILSHYYRGARLERRYTSMAGS